MNGIAERIRDCIAEKARYAREKPSSGQMSLWDDIAAENAKYRMRLVNRLRFAMRTWARRPTHLDSLRAEIRRALS
ncbi:MAG: hypothetical protein ACREQ5_06040 [Candidatus Dormibacteria bacterium]